MKVRERANEAGFISIEMMVAVAMSLLFFVFLLNLLFFGYGKGVLRAAADEGARAGSRIAVATPEEGGAAVAASNAQDVALSITACQKRAESVMESLGSMATRPVIECTVDVDARRVDATVKATFQGWVPPVPDIDVAAAGSSVKELAPQ